MAKKTSGAAAKPSQVFNPAASMFDVAQQLRRWTDNVLGIAGSAGELSLNLAKAGAQQPRQQRSLEKAGSMLRQAREGAGMSLRELSEAVSIADPRLLEQAEVGKAALPMEVVLRLASALGRRDPVPFALKLARTYNPQLWKALDALGIGSLVALAGRERELANLYRGNDDARRLNDADFADVLAFTKTGFDMAVKFRVGTSAERAARRAKAARS
ncbi:MAG TPA: helix-turn-helix transcriptional regulator [Rubrivivax sp.]|nr:helix-turn-helix transcriptional regulator [Rubrivivax sp.]